MPKGNHAGLFAIAVVFGAALYAVGTARSQPAGTAHIMLQIKEGLWEFSEIPRVTGDTIISDAMMARVPAAQRTQYLAETRKAMEQPGKVRECINQKTFEQRVFSVGSGCVQTVVANAASGIEVFTECHSGNGGIKQDNTRKLVAMEPTSVNTSFHGVLARQGKTMTVDSTESGHWLSSNCGDVKGIQQLQ